MIHLLIALALSGPVLTVIPGQPGAVSIAWEQAQPLTAYHLLVQRADGGMESVMYQTDPAVGAHVVGYYAASAGDTYFLVEYRSVPGGTYIYGPYGPYAVQAVEHRLYLPGVFYAT